MALFDPDIDWDYDEIYHVAKAGYTHQFSDLISVGGSLGALIAIDSEILSRVANPMIGVNLVIGNKVDSFAGIVGLELAPSAPSEVFEGGKKHYHLAT